LYLKHPEFYKHDYKKIFSKNPNKAMEILKKCEGIIRFETELRLKQLQAEFKKRKIYLSDITDEKIEALIEKYWQKMDIKEFNKTELINKLVELYGRKEAKNLSLYIGFMQYKPDLVSRSEWYRNKKKIKEAIKLIKYKNYPTGQFQAPATAGTETECLVTLGN
jgi:hypothetical protein